MLTEQIAVTLAVVEALDALGVPYAIGGSFASALHGVMRATMDADLVADLRLEHVEPLAQALGDAFYADAEMMRDAIRRRLDQDYLRRMSVELGVTDLLERVLEEAG